MAGAGLAIGPGDRIPPFRVRSRVNPEFNIETLGGRWIVLGLLGRAAPPPCGPGLAAMLGWAGFDDVAAHLFLLSCDPADEAEGRLMDRLPGRRVFWDFDGAVSARLGALPPEGGAYRAAWVVLDPALTVRRVVPMRADGSCAAELLGWLAAAPPPAAHLGCAAPAPVLILPEVFEPAFCDELIAHHRARGGGELSGFMRDQGGVTVGRHDPAFKVRRDVILEDPDLIAQTQARVRRKVVPQIERVHFFRPTRMERYLIGCYPAAEGGHFAPHRDNTTIGTAHRRFAVSINLSDGFEGGEVSFPEYGPQGYKAPKGAAVVFSCSLLHAVARVRSGTRYAFLPFLYDEAAARLREANAARVPASAGYRA
jgi:predicted 2-oxoglutarate/Fe(II)-dependent dioxygenase YbiX